MPRKTDNSKKTAARRGGILSVILACVGITILGSMGYLLLPRPAMQPVARVERSDLELTLYRVGLKPEFLAAAGVSPQQVSGIVSRMRTHLGRAMPALNAAEAACNIEQHEVTQLRRIVRAGKGSDQQVQDLATAKSSLAESEVERDAQLDAAFAAAAEGLEAEQIATLATLRANGQRWHLPVEYLTVERSDAEWVALRNALANDRISRRLEREPDPEQQALLAQLGAHATVAAAMQGANNLAAIEAAWDEAMAD